jgi:hypothetical protein
MAVFFCNTASRVNCVLDEQPAMIDIMVNNTSRTGVFRRMCIFISLLRMASNDNLGHWPDIPVLLASGIYISVACLLHGPVIG